MGRRFEPDGAHFFQCITPAVPFSFRIRLILVTSLMFMEIGVTELKYQAVLAIIRDGVSIIEVANRYFVSRQPVYSWLPRYEMEGISGLASRSHKPERGAHQMSAVVEVRIIELRRHNFYWRPKQISIRFCARVSILPLHSRGHIEHSTAPARFNTVRAKRGIKSLRGENGELPWSHGRWMWWVESCSPTALS